MAAILGAGWLLGVIFGAAALSVQRLQPSNAGASVIADANRGGELGIWAGVAAIVAGFVLVTLWLG
jgi:hypothetical protein